VRRPSIRTHLLGLTLAAILPIAGAVVYVIVDSARVSLDQATAEIDNIAESTANEIRARISENERLISGLAQLPLVRAVDPRRCDPIVTKFANLHPDYTNLAVRDARGNSVCSRLRIAPASTAVKFPWFQEGIRSEGFVVGEAMRGDASGRWFAPLTYPLRDDRGKVTGVLSLGIDLLRFQERIFPTVPKNVVLAVIDRQGRFLMRSENPEEWIGKSINKPGNAGELQRRAEGSFRLEGVDGVFRHFTYRTVSGPGWIVAVGIPQDALMAPAEHRLSTALAIVVATALLAVVLTRRIGAAIAKPIHDLEATTARVSAGDLGARAPVSGPAEIAHVASEFNRMVETRSREEAELRQSEQRFALAASAGELWELDPQTNHTRISESFFRRLGYEGEDLRRAHQTVEENWTVLVHPDDLGYVREALKAHLEKKTPFDVDARVLTKSGGHLWFSVKGQALWDELGRPVQMAGTATDVTEKKAAEAHVRNLNRIYAVLSGINALIVRVGEREELFQEACRIAVRDGKFRMAWIGVVDQRTDAVRPVAWEGTVGDFFEVAPLAVTATRPGGQGLAGRAVIERKPAVANDIASDPRRMMKKEMAERGINSFAVIPLIVSGEAAGVIALYAAETGFFDEEEMKLLTELADDISFALDHIEKAERLNYVAYYDVLTGLANRTLFNERLTQRIKVTDPDQGLALVLLDIERFKGINDSLGRRAGDDLLKQVAVRLARCTGDAGLVGRMSADSFAIVLDGRRSVDELAHAVESQARACFDEPFRLESGTDLRISARGGVALFPRDGTDAETLHRNAEAALKQAKSTGERFVFYAEHMTERAAEKLTLENQMRLALDREEFVLHYQPKVGVESRAVEGFEALIRWQSPELGLVPPMDFIPLLEETGLILEAGAWAMRRAARDHRGWADRGLSAPRVSVNVSAIQLRKADFVRTVQAALAEGAESTALDLEITESLLMEDVEDNIRKLAAVRDLGVQIAIDDFGTGYSSLRYLARLPVQSVKIDRSFVATMLRDSNTLTLISTIISLAHSLGLKVVAEGVDSEEEAAMLRTLMCDQMQGYLISRPLPPGELRPFLVSPERAAS